MSRTRHHGKQAKQRQFGDNWRWMQSTPRWWTNMCMTVPQRAATTLWQKTAVRMAVEELDTLDPPPHGKKPHIYYW